MQQVIEEAADQGMHHERSAGAAIDDLRQGALL